MRYVSAVVIFIIILGGLVALLNVGEQSVPPIAPPAVEVSASPALASVPRPVPASARKPARRTVRPNLDDQDRDAILGLLLLLAAQRDVQAP